MNSFWENIDYIGAFLITLTCLILIACGIDGEVKLLAGAATGWLFKGGYDLRKTVIKASEVDRSTS